ncbi:MAG: hypothetical protein ACE5KM_17065 [Planctomycetaceae bacterium]
MRAPDRADVRQILDTGLQSDRQSLNAARKLWMQARAKAPRDARVDYAFGLVLRKHSRTTEAERLFRTATKKSRPAWLPAYQALIWLKFARKRNADGLKQLGEFVALVSDKKAASGPAARAAAAEWVGRSIAALEIVKLSPRDTSAMHRVAADAERLFTGPLKAAYDRGVRDVRKVHRDLDVQAIKGRILDRRKETERRAKKSKKIAGKQSNIGVSRIKLKKTAADWKDWFENRRKDTEKKVDRLMKELEILEDRRQSISRSYFIAQAEWNRLRNVARAIAGATSRTQARTGRPVVRPNPVTRGRANQLAVAQLEQQMIGYLNRYTATLRQMSQLRKSGTGLLARHRREIRQYETATGAIVRTNAALARWQKRLKQQEKKLKNTKLGNGKATRTLRRRIGKFSTYVTFDVDKERQMLLKTYAK